MDTGSFDHLGAGCYVVRSGPATIKAVCEVRGPDGKLKGTFSVHGFTELSEQDVRAALNLTEGSKDGSHSYQRGA